MSYDDIFEAIEGTVEDVKYFVEKKGVDINVRDDNGYTLLQGTIYLKNFEVAKYLVSTGANVNAKVENGWTPLHLAASEGTVDIAKILVSAGADVNAKDDDDLTPLCHAKNVEVARFLVSTRADVNARDNKGKTPLFWAENVEVAKVFISAGADVNAKNNNGYTLLDLTDDSAMKQYLKSVGGKTTSSTGQIVGKVLLNEAKSRIGGCYIATAVYGSYDCPQVWTLRRYRDNTLAKNIFGRAFISVYYTVSPTIVKIFGEAGWFTRFWRNMLDKLVSKLRKNGYEDTPYSD